MVKYAGLPTKREKNTPFLCLPMPVTTPKTINFSLHMRRKIISQPFWNLQSTISDQLPLDYEIMMERVSSRIHHFHEMYIYFSSIPSPQRQPLYTIMAEQLVLRGTLEGHSGWVTSLATSLEKYVVPPLCFFFLCFFCPKSE